MRSPFGEINASFTAARARANHSTGSIVQVPRCKCSQCSISNWFWMGGLQSRRWIDHLFRRKRVEIFKLTYTFQRMKKKRERGRGKKATRFSFQAKTRFVVRSFLLPESIAAREKSRRNWFLHGQVHDTDRCVTIERHFIFRCIHRIYRYINYSLNR